MEAVILHPTTKAHGNILWATTPSENELSFVDEGAAQLRELGYWISKFPEGDGLVFSKADYQKDACLEEIRRCFDFMEIHEASSPREAQELLATMSHSQTVKCITLTPIQGMKLDGPVTVGDTRMYPPVDNDVFSLDDHPWGQILCDQVGADVDPNWMPDPNSSGTAAFLAYPAIERRIDVPKSMILRSLSNISSEFDLLAFLIDDADQALDTLRYSLCHFHQLEYLPNKAGWIDDFATVYLKIQDKGFEDRKITGKPSPLRVQNNWLGLEVQPHIASDSLKFFLPYVDSEKTNEIDLRIKSALRSLGKSFYLIDVEAAFLHLVYALDGLCQPGVLSGPRQRIWVSICAAGNRPDLFKEFLEKYSESYSYRNEIVHSGKSFSELQVDGFQKAQLMQRMLGLCIENFIAFGVKTQADVINTFLPLLDEEPFNQALKWVFQDGGRNFKIPVSQDKVFAKISQIGDTRDD